MRALFRIKFSLAKYLRVRLLKIEKYAWKYESDPEFRYRPALAVAPARHPLPLRTPMIAQQGATVRGGVRVRGGLRQVHDVRLEFIVWSWSSVACAVAGV